MTTPRALRYYVYNPNEAYPASYHASFDTRDTKLALNWAIQNARRYHGRVVAENTDGSLTVIRSFERKPEPAQDSV